MSISWEIPRLRFFLYTLYITKRRPLEIEITFKHKIVCSWEQSAMRTVRLYVDRMLRTRGLSKVLRDSSYNNG